MAETKTVPRMPGKPGPQPRAGISPRVQHRIAQLEATPQRFAFNEGDHGTLDDATAAAMWVAK